MTDTSPSAEGMMAAIDASLIDEFARLLTTHMAAAEMGLSARLRWTASFADLSEVIGARYAYMTLRRVVFTPGDNDIWTRAARHSSPAEQNDVWALDADELAPSLRRATAALDPLGLCRGLMVEVA